MEAEHPKGHVRRRTLHWDELAPGAVVAYAGERVLPEGRCPFGQRLEDVDAWQDLEIGAGDHLEEACSGFARGFFSHRSSSLLLDDWCRLAHDHQQYRAWYARC